MEGLRTKSLTVMVDSPSIGATHRDVLQDKLREFQESLAVRQRQLEQRVASPRGSGHTDPTGPQTGRTDPTGPQTGHTDPTGPYPYPLGRHTDHPGPQADPSDPTARQQQELDILHQLFQDRLDQLYSKFQREWQHDPREHAPPAGPACPGRESAYLSRQLGEALGHGLAEVCERRPSDPIEYLACWLQQYARKLQDSRQEAVAELKVRLAREEDVMTRDRQAVKGRERQQIQKEEGRRRKIFMEHESRLTAAETVSTPGADPGEPGADPGVVDTAVSGADPLDKESPVREKVRPPGGADPEGSTTLYTIEEREGESPGQGDRV